MDTSAFVKLFLTEVGSEAMIDFAANERDESKVICALAPVESRSALVKLYRRRNLTSGQLAEAISFLDEEAGRITVQPLTPKVLQAAGELVERHALRVLDAVQLASALIVRSANKGADVRFIASDMELLRAAEAEDFRVWNPAKP